MYCRHESCAFGVNVRDPVMGSACLQNQKRSIEISELFRSSTEQFNYAATNFSFSPSRIVFALTKAAWSVTVCAA